MRSSSGRRSARSISLAAGLAISFGVGLWVAVVTIAITRHFVYAKPEGVDPRNLRRVFVSRGAQATFALAPVVSPAELRAMQEAAGGGCWHVEGYALRETQVEANGYSASLITAEMTPTFLATLGVRPSLGMIESPTSEPVAVLSNRLWRDAFAESLDALGSSIRVDGRLLRVAAILPPGFAGIDPEPARLWMLLPADATSSDVYFLNAIVRLCEPSAELSVASSLRVAVSQPTQAPQSIAGVVLRPLTSNRFGDDGPRRIAPLALTLALAVLILALCTCFLVLTSLFYRRLPELRIRSALGAQPAHLWLTFGRWPLATVLGTAILVVGAMSSSVRALAFAGIDLPIERLDSTTLLLVPCVAVVSSIALFSALVLAQWTTVRVPGAGALDSGVPSFLRRTLTFCYLTTSTALAVVVTPVLGAYLQVLRIDPGFTPQGALAISARIGRVPQVVETQEVDNVLRELAATPGVIHAAASTSLPFANVATAPIVTGDERVVNMNLIYVMGDFFGALGIPDPRGPSDHTFAAQTGRVAVVNQRLAGEWTQSILGKCLALPDDPCYVVTGVVSNSDLIVLGERPRPIAYARMPDGLRGAALYFVIRTAGDDAPHERQRLERIVQFGFPSASVKTIALTALVDRQRAPMRRFTVISLLLLTIAGLLALCGIRAMMALLIETRRHEMGIVAALGASRVRVFLSCCRGVADVAVMSLSVGSVAGWALARILAARVSGLLFGAPIHDLVAGFLFPIVIAALAMMPAFRVAGAEPADLLASPR